MHKLYDWIINVFAIQQYCSFAAIDVSSMLCVKVWKLWRFLRLTSTFGFWSLCYERGAPPRVINLYVIEQKPQQWAQERLSHLFLWRKEDFFNYFAYLFWLSGNPVGVMIANVLAPAFVTKKSNIPQMVGRTC